MHIFRTDRFDPGVIEFTESMSQDLIELYKVPRRMVSEVAGDVSASINKTRKRLLEDDTVERTRIVKRSKICSTGNTPRTPYMPRKKSKICTAPSPSAERAYSCDDGSSPCHRIATQDIESEIDSNFVDTALLRAGIEEHTTFWECISSLTQSGRTPLSLRIEDVLRAPEIGSTLFLPGGEYMGKPFHVNRKDPNSIPSTIVEKRAFIPETAERGQGRRKEHSRLKPATRWLDLRTVVKRHCPRSKRLRLEA